MKDKSEEQKEFFEEFKKPKRGIERFREKYLPKRQFFVTISVETLILLSISVIMVIVLFFSLGVERGRRINRVGVSKLEENITDIPTIEVEEKSIKEEILIEESSAKYTVQIVTYKDEAAANREINALKKEGFVAFIMPKGNLFQVCVGRYKTVAEAKDLLKELRNRYSDCFVRRTDTN